MSTAASMQDTLSDRLDGAAGMDAGLAADRSSEALGRKRSSDKPQDNSTQSSDPQTKRARLSHADITTDVLHPNPTPPPSHDASCLKSTPREEEKDEPTISGLKGLVSAWLDSLSPTRERRYNAESGLDHHSEGPGLGKPSDERLTKSLPNLSVVTRDLVGFAVPPVPDRPGSIATSDAVSEAMGVSSAKTLVGDSNYRDLNLCANRIYLREPYLDYPEGLADLVSGISANRRWPGSATADRVRFDVGLHSLENGAAESEVEQYFSGAVFVAPTGEDSLRRTDRMPMNKQTVPKATPLYRLSTPVPHMLYGYDLHAGLSEYSQHLASLGSQPFANTAGLVYPFFAVDFKGEGGSLWVATNQCIAGSVSCINMVEQLNRKLLACHVGGLEPKDRVAFSVAVSGTEARIYMSWLHSNGLDYYMQKIRSFCIQEPDQFVRFQRCINNVIEWGRTARLQALRGAFDRLFASDAFKPGLATQQQSRSRSGSASSSSASATGGQRQKT